jgi:hypothetical protein
MLVLMAKWAQYPDKVQPLTPLLEDMKVYDDLKLETRVVMGYDVVTNSIITTYRGTVTKLNWIEDFDFKKVDYLFPGCNNCSVHQGFFVCYNSLSEKVESYIQVLTAKYPNATVVVTGHSLGAAIAMLSAAV